MDVVLATGETLTFEVQLANSSAEISVFSLFNTPDDARVEALFIPYGTRT
jgi:hypothetical protein